MFVEQVKQAFGSQVIDFYTSLAPALPVGESEKRGDGRFACRFRVRFKSTEDLASVVFAGDVSVGGMFLETEAELALGQLIQLDVVHPTSGKAFQLKASIRWRGEKQGKRGVGVQFVNMSVDQAVEFESFTNERFAQSFAPV